MNDIDVKNPASRPEETLSPGEKATADEVAAAEAEGAAAAERFGKEPAPAESPQRVLHDENEDD